MLLALVIIHDLDLARIALAELEADPTRPSVNGKAREPVSLDVIVSAQPVSLAPRVITPGRGKNPAVVLRCLESVPFRRATASDPDRAASGACV
jgi:hypothetical protein